MDPLVSERVYIKWDPDSLDAVCDSSEQVIVIQGRTGFYLDLRWQRDTTRDVLTWATAGWKTIEAPREGEKGRARFTPVFDSHRAGIFDKGGREEPDDPPDDPPDEGSFETLENGDVVERGEMRSPETGLVTPYEELWRRLPLTADSSETRICFLETASQVSGSSGADRNFAGRVGDHEIGLQYRDGLVSALAQWRRGSEVEVVAAAGDVQVLRAALESVRGDMASTEAAQGLEGWHEIEKS